MSSIHFYVRQGDRENAERFLNNGTDVNLVDENGYTPLNWACREGHGGCVNRLLNHGANMEIQERNGKTPLHWACYKGHERCVTLLLDHGANPFVRNNKGKTPRDIVCKGPSNHNNPAIKSLLEEYEREWSHQRQKEEDEENGEAKEERFAKEEEERLTQEEIERLAEYLCDNLPDMLGGILLDEFRTPDSPSSPIIGGIHKEEEEEEEEGDGDLDIISRSLLQCCSQLDNDLMINICSKGVKDEKVGDRVWKKPVGDCGSTAVIAVVSEEEVWVCSVGDSPAFLLSTSVLEKGGDDDDEGGDDGQWTVAKITKDHSPDDLEERERVERLGGEVATRKKKDGSVLHKVCVGGDDGIYLAELAMSRSFGDFLFKDNQDFDLSNQIVTPTPDLLHFKRDQSTSLLVLCSDGLTDEITLEELSSTLSSSSSSSLPEQCDSLVELAVSRGCHGGGDNVALLAIDIRSPSSPLSTMMREVKI